MSTKKPFTATKLRLTLSVSLFLIVLIAGGLFYAANRTLNSLAADVSRASAEASASQDSLQTLQNTEKELARGKDAIKRTAEIVAESQSYQYQNQIISDINDFAKRAGVTITNIDFTDTSSSSSSSKPALGSPVGPGIKSTYASITLKNPVGYNNLLTFMHLIEQNLTKMQIASVSISKSDESADAVNSNALTLEVYIR